MIDHTIVEQRIDIWFWHARLYKTRSISSDHIRQNNIRLNSRPVLKTSSKIKINDILTFPWNERIRVIKILALTKQRVSAKTIPLVYQEIFEKELIK